MCPGQIILLKLAHTKSLGSTNPHNMVRATMNGLSRLVSARQVARERGVDLDQIAYKPRQEG